MMSRITLYINLDFKAHFSRAEFVQEFSYFCKNIRIEEICKVKNKDNNDFIKNMCNEITSLKE